MVSSARGSGTYVKQGCECGLLANDKYPSTGFQKKSLLIHSTSAECTMLLHLRGTLCHEGLLIILGLWILLNPMTAHAERQPPPNCRVKHHYHQNHDPEAIERNTHARGRHPSGTTHFLHEQSRVPPLRVFPNIISYTGALAAGEVYSGMAQQNGSEKHTTQQ